MFKRGIYDGVTANKPNDPSIKIALVNAQRQIIANTAKYKISTDSLPTSQPTRQPTSQPTATTATTRQPTATTATTRQPTATTATTADDSFVSATNNKLNALKGRFDNVTGILKDTINQHISDIQNKLMEIPNLDLYRRAIAEGEVRSALKAIDKKINGQDDNKYDNKHVDEIDDNTLISYLKEMYTGANPLDLQKFNGLLSEKKYSQIQRHDEFAARIQDIKSALGGGNNIALLYCAYKNYIYQFNQHLVNNNVNGIDKMTDDLLNRFVTQWKNSLTPHVPEKNIEPLAKIMHNFYIDKFEENAQYAVILKTQRAELIFKGTPLVNLNVEPDDDGFDAEYSWG